MGGRALLPGAMRERGCGAAQIRGGHLHTQLMADVCFSCVCLYPCSCSCVLVLEERFICSGSVACCLRFLLLTCVSVCVRCEVLGRKKPREARHMMSFVFGGNKKTASGRAAAGRVACPALRLVAG